MTGYQEILTDPSYMAQIVAFTFPHIGNVGTNAEDLEQIPARRDDRRARRDLPRRCRPPPANWRADSDLDGWLKRRGVIGLAGVDTRALTKRDPRAGHAARRSSPIARTASSTSTP